MGFRRFLNRSGTVETPLERLAELGRAEDPPEQEGRPGSPVSTSTPGPFAGRAREGGTSPTSDVGLVKKGELVSESAVRVSAGISKKEAGPRSRSGYCWVSPASRDRRSQATDFANTSF